MSQDIDELDLASLTDDALGSRPPPPLRHEHLQRQGRRRRRARMAITTTGGITGLAALLAVPLILSGADVTGTPDVAASPPDSTEPPQGEQYGQDVREPATFDEVLEVANRHVPELLSDEPEREDPKGDGGRTEAAARELDHAEGGLFTYHYAEDDVGPSPGPHVSPIPVSLRIKEVPAGEEDQFENWYRSMLEEAVLPIGGVTEGADDGWPDGAIVAVVDKRPSYVQVMFLHNHVSVTLRAENEETHDHVYDWGQSIANGLDD